MRRSIDLGMHATFWVALLVLGGLVVRSYVSTSEFLRRSVETREADYLVERITHLLAALSDAETGQRGYLLTGDSRYLDSYHASLPEIANAISAIRDLTVENRSQRPRIDAVAPLIDARLEQLATTIDVRRRRGFAAARAMILTHHGKTTMDDIRRSLAEIETVARDDAAARATAASMAHRWGEFQLMMGIIVALVFVSAAHTAASQRLEARRRFERATLEAERARSASLARIGQEMQAPMSAILTSTEVLALDEASPDTRATHLDLIRRNGDEVLGIVGEILELATGPASAASRTNGQARASRTSSARVRSTASESS
jgi:CHASE3 domain sensor protein